MASTVGFEISCQLKYFWLGGLLGVIYLTITIILTPLLDAATIIRLILAGQILASIVLDHFGLMGYLVHALEFWRVIGAIFFNSLI